MERYSLVNAISQDELDCVLSDSWDNAALELSKAQGFKSYEDMQVNHPTFKGELGIVERHHEVIPIEELGDFDDIRQLPPYDNITRMYDGWHNPHHKFISNWFFNGFKYSESGLIPRKGVDANKALRVIGTILRSFQPSHEHKTSGCARLLDAWFILGPIPEKVEEEVEPTTMSTALLKHDRKPPKPEVRNPNAKPKISRKIKRIKSS